MDWNDLENGARQQGQNITNASQNMINQNVDQPIAAKLQALQQMSAANAPAPTMGAPQPMPSPVDQVQPNAPTMTPQDQQSRMGAMIAANENMQAIQAKQAAQAQQDQAAQNHMNDVANDPMNGYTQVKSIAQRLAEAPAPRQFHKIQGKIKAGQPINKHDIRESLTAGQEITPEIEAQMGYGEQAEDKE